MEDAEVVANLCRVLRAREFWITCLDYDGGDMMGNAGGAPSMDSGDN
jgi:hypothetical protein